jgi:hypothetical protein
VSHISARRPLRAARITVTITTTVGLSLLAAGCGGSPSGGHVAQLGSTTTNVNSPSTTSAAVAQQTGGLASSRCMRSNGVSKFPDPSASNARPSGVPKVSLQQLGVSSSRFEAVQRACRNLLPGGSEPRQTRSRQMLTKMLQFSQCMHSHGVSNWPDPTASTPLALAQGAPPYMFQLGGLQGLDGRSFAPQIKSAMAACEHRTGAQVAYSG